MLQAIIKKKILKNLFSILILSIVLSPILSQKQEDKYTFGMKKYELNFNKNGTICLGQNLFSMRLTKIQISGKDKTNNERKDIQIYEFDDKNTWGHSNPTAKNFNFFTNNASFTIKDLQTQDSESTKLSMDIETSLKDEIKQKYSDINYYYYFSYKSHLPFENYWAQKIDNDSKIIRSTLFESLEINGSKFDKTDDELVFSTEKIPLKIQYEIYGNQVKETSQLKEADFAVNYNKYGKASLKQPINPNFSETTKFEVINIVDVNNDGKFNIENNNRVAQANNQPLKTPEKKDNSVNFNFHNFGSNKLNVEMFYENESTFNTGFKDIVPAFNKGDILVTFDFSLYSFCRDENPKDGFCEKNKFGKSQFLDIGFKVNFSKIDLKYFYAYPKMIAPNKESKIESLSIQNKVTSKGSVEEENYFKLRTTPFNNGTKIQILFKFFDSKMDTLLNKKPFKHDEIKEELHFKNLGGDYYFNNPDTNKRNRVIRLDQIVETDKDKKIIRDEFTNYLYFKIINSEDEKTNFKSVSNTIFELSNISFDIKLPEEHIKDHKYINDKGEDAVEKVELEEGEIFVSFNLSGWTPCTEESFIKKNCQNKKSELLSVRLYLEEIIEKKAEKEGRLLQKKEDPKKEEDLNIEVTPLKGNYKNHLISGIDNKQEFSEKIVQFDFNPNMENKQANINHNASFKIKYTTIINKKKDDSDSGIGIYIALIVIFALVAIAITIFFIRRNNKKVESQSSSESRLEDSS